MPGYIALLVLYVLISFATVIGGVVKIVIGLVLLSLGLSLDISTIYFALTWKGKERANPSHFPIIPPILNGIAAWLVIGKSIYLVIAILLFIGLHISSIVLAATGRHKWHTEHDENDRAT